MNNSVDNEYRGSTAYFDANEEEPVEAQKESGNLVPITEVLPTKIENDPTKFIEHPERNESSNESLQAKSNQDPSTTPSLDFRKQLDLANLKLEKTEAYFFNNGMGVALGGLFFSLNAIVGAHAAYQFSAKSGFHTDNDILRITLPIARVGGRLVTFNCAWLLLTACKYLWTMVRTHVVPILPVGFPIDNIMPKYHRFVALWIIICGNIIHGVPQVINYASGALKIDDGKKIWTFGNGYATRQLLITGILLTLIFTMFYLTTLKSFRKSAAGFRWFWLFHMAGIALAYPLLIVHGTFRGHPIFLISALAPLALYLFDVIMRRSKIANSKVLEWKTHDGGEQKIIELVVECPPNFVYTPGQYAELRFRPISGNEWHPFTIASAPNSDARIYDGKNVKVLVFFIRATGRWTEAFYDYAAAFDLSKATMQVSVRGPHGAPAANFSEYRDIIVIGSGVGVTPLLSVWQYMVGRSKQQNNPELTGSLSKFVSKHATQAGSTDDASYTDGDSFESMPVEEPSKFRKKCSKAMDFMQSLTVSICLYGIFLTFLTIIIVSQIFGYHEQVVLFEIAFATSSVTFHASTLLISACALGLSNYVRQFKCWIEITITMFDAFNLWLSVTCFLGALGIAQSPALRLIVLLGVVSVFLHALRIFNIFYTTLKPNNTDENSDDTPDRNKVSSIQGIFINRKYDGMKFCFKELLQPLEEEGHKNFSLQFYGTREKSNDASGLPIAAGSADNEDSRVPSSMKSLDSATAGKQDFYSFHKGRPDWESIFHKAIRKAQISHQGTSSTRSIGSNGEISIGVFFCGSPAIAKTLRSVADKVNAQHRFAANKSKGKYQRCKIVIHVENF